MFLYDIEFLFKLLLNLDYHRERQSPMGWKESVSSTIKTKAVDKYTNRSYHDLEEGKKDIIW